MNRDASIRPSEEHPFYWRYGGQTSVLLGGSDEDNAFQWTGTILTDHLDTLAACGGNFIRNTMSDRDDGNIYAFEQIEEGTYDLERWNGEYFRRLSTFLEETERRGIVVQITLWDQHDLSSQAWERHPWNPARNVNYDGDNVSDPRAFFNTVRNRNTAVLPHQERFVDRVLDLSLEYGHVLYNINNESWTGLAWELYWADRIHGMAKGRERNAYVTAMHLSPSTSVRAFMSHRDRLNFAEISQNNQVSMGASGQEHMDNILLWRDLIAKQSPAPLNNEKVYGAGEGETTQFGTGEEARRRYWRNIFGGCACTRFHRPIPTMESGGGLGLSDSAQRTIRSARLFCDAFDVPGSAPHNEVFVTRDADTAYCLAAPGSRYAFYFTNGGSVEFDPWLYVDSFRLRWLNVAESRWEEPEGLVAVEWESYRIWSGEPANVPLHGRCRIECPGPGPWVAILMPDSTADRP